MDGLRLRGVRPRFLIAWLLVVCAWAGEKPAKPARNAKDSVAVIAGSVFREPGFSLPGAQIALQPDPEQKTSIKVRKMKAVSDARGEFSFRVPPVPMRYTLSFQASGFQSESRPVTISGEERQDVFVTLKSAKEASK